MKTEDRNTILIVDDDDLNLKFTSKILIAAEYNVITAKSSTEAFAVIETCIPDLILLDVFLHNEFGYDILAKIKKNDSLKSIFVVMITGFKISSEDQARVLEMGADGFISRSIDKRELVARVESFLRHKRVIDELDQANRTLKKFFSILSHDLKAPFFGILNLTDMMANDSNLFTIAEYSENSKLLNKSANNLYLLLGNLLEWAQMQNGTLAYSPEEFKLKDIITNNISKIDERASQKGITIINNVPDAVNILADENMINAVILNLLSNAVKFTNRKGQITINSVPIETGMIKISVKDTGIGMSETIIQKLFIAGEKVGTRGTAGELSTGLGLILCKEFVEKHNGKIWAESKIGNGSVFHFTMRVSG